MTRMKKSSKPEIILLKRQTIAHFRRLKSLTTDFGQTVRNLKAINFDCLMVFETSCASVQYRVEHSLQILKSLDFSPEKLSLAELDNINSYHWLDKIRLILLHRLPLNPSLNKLLKAAHQRNIPTLLDIDDAIHNPSLYCQSAVFDHLNSIEKSIHSDMSERIAKILRQVSAVTVSTDILHQYTSEMAIIEPLSIILKKFSDSRFLIAGPLELPSVFQEKFHNQIIRYPLEVWPDFLKYYGDLNVNLAPLEQQNPFCQAKSGIKFLEAGISAVPTIASPTPDFKRLIQHLETGFVAETSQDWVKWMDYCLSKPDTAAQIGKNARSHILEFETIEQNKDIWKKVLLALGISL